MSNSSRSERRRRGPLTWFAAILGTNWAVATVGGGLLLSGLVFMNFTSFILLREQFLVPYFARGTAQAAIDALCGVAVVSIGLGIAMLGLVAYRLARDAVTSAVQPDSN